MTAVRGSPVDIPMRDGTADAYLAHPGGTGPFPGVLLHMDAFGLRPHLKKMADRLASASIRPSARSSSSRSGRSSHL